MSLKHLYVATQYTNYLEDNYYDVIDCIKNEVVYLLFQNREFLMHFNIFMSDVLPGKSDRKNCSTMGKTCSQI